MLGEDTTDLERALELMLWIPTRCNDLKFITNIEGFHGNLHKLGRLIRHVSSKFFTFCAKAAECKIKNQKGNYFKIN